MLLSRNGFRVLFTGDIGAEKEEEIIRRYGELLAELDLLKTAHHGSRFSSCEAFLKITSPAFAVISCGRGNRYGHPHDETLARFAAAGTRVLRTDLGGAVRVSVNEENVITAASCRPYQTESKQEIFPEVKRRKNEHTK